MMASEGLSSRLFLFFLFLSLLVIFLALPFFVLSSFARYLAHSDFESVIRNDDTSRFGRWSKVAWAVFLSFSFLAFLCVWFFLFFELFSFVCVFFCFVCLFRLQCR